MRAELGKDGVRVNAVGPGLIETPLNAQARASNPDIARLSVERTPLGRTGQPEDVVGPVIFLASDLAAYVTGTIIMLCKAAHEMRALIVPSRYTIRQRTRVAFGGKPLRGV